MNITSNNSSSEIDLGQVRRLHQWLSSNRFTIFIYGALFILPTGIVLAILILLAVLFAPYMLFVLYRNGKRGWLIFFAVIVGIPIALAFLSTGNPGMDTALHFLPLLTFYLYCFILHYTVDEWISDASPTGELEIDEENRQNKLDQ